MMLTRIGAIGSKRLITTVTLAALALIAPHDAAAASNGKSVLHIAFKTAMTNTLVDTDARGTVTGDVTRRGNTYDQTLKITLSDLDPNTTYGLTAVVGEDPNSAPIAIAEFSTDGNGKAKIAYAKRNPGQGIGGRDPLPDGLDPLSLLREIFVINEDSAIVLQADVREADKWQYLDRRAMNETSVIPGASGRLRIEGNQRNQKLHVGASGLIPGDVYRLVLDDEIFPELYTANARGKLVVRALPPGSPDVRDIRTVALVDADDSVVLISGGLGTIQSGVPLGSAAAFAVLGGSTVTNTGATVVTGDLGLSPGSEVTGIPPGIVVGTQHVTDPTAAQAKLDLTTAYNDAAGRTLAPISVAGNIGGQTLAPGLYKSTDSLEISSGDLTLDAQGDANGVFIFQIASTLLTTSGRQVILSGGARAENVFWQVGTSATIGTTSVFKGTIMADQTISLLTGAMLEGRALARIAAVNLAGSTVSLP